MTWGQHFCYISSCLVGFSCPIQVGLGCGGVPEATPPDVNPARVLACLHTPTQRCCSSLLEIMRGVLTASCLVGPRGPRCHHFPCSCPPPPQGYAHSQEFITTQGPLKKTLGDFWRLLWEQQVRVILMLTVGMDNGRVSSPQSPEWPPGGTCAPCRNGHGGPGVGGWVRRN